MLDLDNFGGMSEAINLAATLGQTLADIAQTLHNIDARLYAIQQSQIVDATVSGD